MVVIFGLKELTRGKVREPNKIMHESRNGGHAFDIGGSHNQHSLKRSGKVLFNSSQATVKF